MKLVSENLKAYNREILFQTEAFEIISIEWTDESISPLHAHGWSQCLVLIVEGTFENRLDLGTKVEVQVLEVGQVASTPVGAGHEMRCKSLKGRTLHVYLPKLNNLDDSRKFSPSSLNSLEQEVELSGPTNFEALKSIIALLKAQSISTHSPYFMNQLFSGVLPQMLIAEEFVTQTKTTLATFEASPVLSKIEAEVVESLCELIGWNSGNRSGLSVPGGSAANLMALHCARQKVNPEAKAKGINGIPFKVFISEEAHYSFKKGCAVLGIGTDHLLCVPVDEKGRMKPDLLDKQIERNKQEGGVPLLVAATAGTTVLGAFDELVPLSLVCQRHGVWLHVDGAWGGPALFSKKLKHLFQGVKYADSVTFNAHKLFGANLTSSFFLTRHNQILLEANDVSGGDYLFHSDDPTLDRGKFSWQCGRRADAVSFWTIWKSLGTEGLGEFVDRLIDIREKTLTWIKTQSRLELISDPEYLNICVRVLAPTGVKNSDWSKRVREHLKENDQAMVNYSANKDGSFLRLILAHPYLKFEHVRQILEWAKDVQ